MSEHDKLLKKIVEAKPALYEANLRQKNEGAKWMRDKALSLHNVSGAKRKVCPICWQPLEDGIVKNMCVNDECATNLGQTYR